MTDESAAKFTKQKIGFSNEKSHQAKWSAPEKKNIENVGIEDLARVLKELDNSIKNGKNGVEFPNRLFFLRTMLVERIYVNSDGANLRGRVPRLQFHSYISTKHNGGEVMKTRYFSALIAAATIITASVSSAVNSRPSSSRATV